MSKRFNQYREIAATFDSVGTCGHPIKRGDRIGYARGVGRWDRAETQCAACWSAWRATVASDDFDARQMGCS